MPDLTWFTAGIKVLIEVIFPSIKSKRPVVGVRILSKNERLIAQIEFTEWTPDGHLRHSRFVGLRDDKTPHDVVRETGSCTA